MEEAVEERISSRWQPMVRLEEMVTPRTRIEVTLIAPWRMGAGLTEAPRPRRQTMSSRVFRGLSWRLLDAAQDLMWENSSFTVLICLEPTRRYESSVNFIMELGGRFACRSDAATTYDGGPMTDPWITLALMKAIAEMMSWIMVTWPRCSK